MILSPRLPDWVTARLWPCRCTWRPTVKSPSENVVRKTAHRPHGTHAARRRRRAHQVGVMLRRQPVQSYVAKRSTIFETARRELGENIPSLRNRPCAPLAVIGGERIEHRVAASRRPECVSVALRPRSRRPARTGRTPRTGHASGARAGDVPLRSHRRRAPAARPRSPQGQARPHRLTITRWCHHRR